MLALLKNGYFWCILAIVNGLFVEVQPLVLGLSAGLVAVLFVLGKLLEFSQFVRSSPRAQRVLTVTVLWLASAGVLFYYLGEKAWIRPDGSGVLTVVVLNVVIWVVPPLCYTFYRRRREAADLAARQAASAIDRSARDAAQKRRENARANCELLYTLHAPELKDRFPRSEFDAFVKKHLSDVHDPQFVEERAGQLTQIIEHHRHKIEPAKKKASLADLAEWFLQEKKQIDATPLDAEDKAALLAQLEARFAKLQEKHIRSMEP